MLAQRFVNGRAVREIRHQYRGKARPEHRQQHCKACGHLDDEDDAGNRGLHDPGEEGSHADHGECLGLDAEIGKGEAADSAVKRSELCSEDEHRGEQAAWGRRRIRDNAQS